MEWNEAMNLLNEVHKDSTVWSNVYNTKNLDLITAYKTDYNNLYKFNVLKPMEYTKEEE